MAFYYGLYANAHQWKIKKVSLVGKRRDSWAGVAIYRAAKKAISYNFSWWGAVKALSYA